MLRRDRMEMSLGTGEEVLLLSSQQERAIRTRNVAGSGYELMLGYQKRLMGLNERNKEQIDGAFYPR